MSTMKYISYVQYMVNTDETNNIEIRIDEILERKGKSFYWLAKNSGISYSTLWRLKSGKAMGINFVTLERICSTLECHPGELLDLASAKK